MKTMIRYFSGALLTLVTYSAVGADAHSIRHEIELFLNSSVGNIVMFILMLLFLLWLLLPLAVFGLKSKLNNIIRENENLNRESKELIKLLAEIRDELIALSKQETTKAYSDKPERTSDQDVIKDLIQENDNLTRENKETNKILADIRDILTALSAEETTHDGSEQSERADSDDITLDTYNEIKFDP